MRLVCFWLNGIMCILSSQLEPTFSSGCYDGLRECAYYTGNCEQKDYNGTRSSTDLGFICQNWSSLENNSYNDEHSYCRTTNDSSGPWCYTLIGNVLQRQYCFKLCSKIDTSSHGKRTTTSGRTIISNSTTFVAPARKVYELTRKSPMSYQDWSVFLGIACGAFFVAVVSCLVIVALYVKIKSKNDEEPGSVVENRQALREGKTSVGKRQPGGTKGLSSTDTLFDIKSMESDKSTLVSREGDESNYKNIFDYTDKVAGASVSD